MLRGGRRGPPAVTPRHRQELHPAPRDRLPRPPHTGLAAGAEHAKYTLPRCTSSTPACSHIFLGADKARIVHDDQVTGRLVENFVAIEIVKHVDWAQIDTRVHHYRSADSGPRQPGLGLRTPARAAWREGSRAPTNAPSLPTPPSTHPGNQQLEHPRACRNQAALNTTS